MRSIAVWSVIAVHGMAMAAAASPGDAVAQRWRFDIPRQSAVGGIAAFSRQSTSVQLLVSQDAVRGRRTNRLSGLYSVESGLTMLLRGSGLRWLRTGPTTYSLVVVAKDLRR